MTTQPTTTIVTDAVNQGYDMGYLHGLRAALDILSYAENKQWGLLDIARKIKETEKK